MLIVNDRLSVLVVYLKIKDFVWALNRTLSLIKKNKKLEQQKVLEK